MFYMFFFLKKMVLSVLYVFFSFGGGFGVLLGLLGVGF